MPIYEYLCNDCGERYERIILHKNQPVTCPKCSSAKHTLELSVFAAPANSNKPGTQRSARPAGTCGCTPHSCGCH
ncbi:MAG TPA: FmdB family zinc ribbon protein [Candidatus Cybelea sp.]|nr:FmdB family zinc ribbon protein [Candidatus Cybelea sp.]